jgi:hypothetical protein
MRPQDSTKPERPINRDLLPLCPRCGSHRVRIVGTVKHSALRRAFCPQCENTLQLVTDRHE